jgi:hypothetical protein
MTSDDRKLLNEIADRARRTETRVTKIANHMGIDAGGEKPSFNPVTHTLTVPSRRTSLEDIIAAVPTMHQNMVRVVCGDDYMLTFSV